MDVKINFIRAFAVVPIVTMLAFVVDCSQPMSFSGATPSQNSSTNTPTENTTTTESFKFGSGVTSGTVDILIVDDNSGSMQDDQQHLAAGFSNFISELSGVDWQIAVTTTDVCNDTDYDCRGDADTFPPARGRFVGPIAAASTTPFSTQYIMTPNTPNVATVFSDTIQRTDNSGNYLIGSGDERAIYAANMTIAGANDPTIAQGFFRSDAGLAIVILSNEDERSCGNDPDCHGDADNVLEYMPFDANDYPSSLVTNVQTTFGPTKNFAVHSLIIKPDDPTCFNQENAGGGNYGDTYATLTQMTGGILASLCDGANGQYAQDLSAISQSIANTTQPVINLQHVPVERPTVTFNPPSNITFTWTPSSQQITLSAYPANTNVSVTYEY